MTDRINVLGVSIDVVEKNELLQELAHYLENDYLNVIFFATIQILEKASIDNNYRELLDCADYLLPGEKAIFSTCAPWLLKQPQLFTGLESIVELAELEQPVMADMIDTADTQTANRKMAGGERSHIETADAQTANIELNNEKLNNTELNNAKLIDLEMVDIEKLDAEKKEVDTLKLSINSIYCIGRTKAEIQWMIDYIYSLYPDIAVQGIFCEGMEEKEELLVNEINAAAPDLLLVTLDSPFQEEWIINNSTKLNAKLCIALGALCEELITQQSNKKITIHTKFLKFCQKIIKKYRMQSFQKKADQYKKTS